MESFLRDIRLAARGLRRNLGFTAVAVITLALGIGATTTVFSVVYGVLLRPLPFPHAARLVQIIQTLEAGPGEEGHRAGLSPDQFANLRDYSTTLEAVGVLGMYSSRTLSGIPVPVRLNGASVTVGLFGGLGVAPILGRLFQEDDAAPGADPVVVLSERTWRRHFAADTGIIDRRIALGDTQTRVVGVMPAAMTFPSLADPSLSRDSVGELQDAPEFWMPIRPFERSGPSEGYTVLQAWALLKPDTSLEQAEAETRSIAGPLPNGKKPPLELVGAREEMGLPARRVLLIFQAGVTLVLLIAVINVINLLLARAAGKRHELAVRAALGAGRARIVREGMSEALLLSLVGGALGCALAYALTGALQALPPHVLPRLRDIRVDTIVLAFALAVSIVTGLCVGLWSTWRAGRVDASVWLQRRHWLDSPRRGLRPSSMLVVLEIGAAMMLLTTSGLLVNSFIRLVRVDVGYDPRGVLTFEVELRRSRYAAGEARNRFLNDLSTGIRAIPGVESVGAENRGGIGFYPLFVDGQPAGNAHAEFRSITPDYFRTLRLPILEGREFRADDIRARPGSVIVNESFVRRHVPTGSALGRSLRFAPWLGSLEIVGVVADAKRAFNAGDEPALYLPPDGTDGIANLTMLARVSNRNGVTSSAGGVSEGVVTAVREALRQLDPQMAAYNVTTLEETLSHQSANPRFHGLLSMACAVVALLLAVIGLYGVLAYSVRARWREFGIRVALGATAGTVLSDVLRQALTLTGIGLAAGLAGSYLATRSLTSLLFGVTPHDATTFVAVSALFIATALCAAYIPSRRATRLDPAVALRAE
jgi:putative ABC transport system permease protein